MATITSHLIALVTSDNGINFESFKTFRDLLKAVVSFRMRELTYKDRMNQSAAFVQIQREVKKQLSKIIEAEKDESNEENVCSISGEKNCSECPSRQVEKCQGKNMDNPEEGNNL